MVYDSGGILMAEEVIQPRTQNKIYLQTGLNAGPSTELHYGDLIYNKDGTLNTVNEGGFPIALAQQATVNELREDTKNKLARKADLDDNGLVPASQLPSYVDDVMEYENKNTFPRPGESHKVYVDVTTNMTYRWSGSDYVIVGNDLALGETAATAYAGDKGKANAEKIAAILDGTLQAENANKLDGLEGSDYLTKVEYDALDKNQVIVSADPPSSKIATV